jgi:hypothetical protein
MEGHFLMRDSVRVALRLVALAGAFAAAVAAPAVAQNLGDVPANRALDARCSQTAYLGPTVTGWCTDRNNLVIKSRIDVRGCPGYALTVDASGRLRCRGR